MNILVWYVILSFLVLFCANCITRYNKWLPDWLQNNNVLYNISSVLRTLLVGGFLVYHPHLKKFRFLKYLLPAYLVFVAGVFVFDNFLSKVSIPLTSVTSIILLIICLTYFLNAILDDEDTITVREPAFIISMGLSIYESINFFIYLFLYKLAYENPQFGIFTIRLFMYSVIMYNIFIAFAFYYARKRKRRPVLSLS